MPATSVLIYVQLRYCTQISSNTQLCAVKKSIWPIFSLQFPFHLLNLYLVYNQLQNSLRENIPRGAGFSGKGRKVSNTNMYIFCSCQADMWQSQSCIWESFTTLVKVLYQGLFFLSKWSSLWSPSIITSVWTQNPINAHSSSLSSRPKHWFSVTDPLLKSIKLNLWMALAVHWGAWRDLESKFYLLKAALPILT